jgi:hypothetical protein
MKKLLFLVLMAVQIFGSEPVQSDVQDVQKEKIEHIKKLLRANEACLQAIPKRIAKCDEIIQAVPMFRAVTGLFGSSTGVATFGAFCYRVRSQKKFSWPVTVAVGVGTALTTLCLGGEILTFATEKIWDDYKQQFVAIESVAKRSLAQQKSYIQFPNKPVDYDALKDVKHFRDFILLTEDMDS